MDIKPIETIWNGSRFRSRLEARWAVFFNQLGIEYEYEKEGYELPSGRYLPDFWLPDTKLITTTCFDIDINGLILNEPGLWVEIKPNQASWKERKKLYELGEATKFPVLLLCGVPREYSERDESDWSIVHPETAGEGIQLFRANEEGECFFRQNHWEMGESDLEDNFQAFSRASMARFEFGEAPAPVDSRSIQK